MRSGRLVREAAILAAAGLGCKLLGGLSKLPLAWLLGPEGIGVFQLAFTFYGLVLALAVSGLPVATVKLVAERAAVHDPAGARAAFRLAYALLFVVGAGAAAALYAAAPAVASGLLKNPLVAGPVRATAPAVFLVGLAAAYRGYFQGHRRFAPTALSQVVEQAVRVSAMLALAYLLRPRGLGAAVTGTGLGNTVGAAAALITVAWLYRRSPPDRPPSGGRPLPAALPRGRRRRQSPGEGPRRRGAGRPRTWDLVRSLAATAVPVSAGSVVLPVTEAAAAVIVLARLQAAGHSAPGATYLYGELYGLAFSLVTLPAIAAAALAAALVPSVAGAVAAGDSARAAAYARSSLRLTVIGALPAVVGLYLLATPICGLLFRAPQAGVALAPLAPAALFIALQQTTSGVLLGLGRPVVPVVGMVLGGLANVTLAFWLVAQPAFGIAGAALAVVAGYAVAAAVNLGALLRREGFSPGLMGAVLKPGIATWLMAAAVVRGHPLLAGALGEGLGVLAAAALGTVVYVVAMLALRGFTRRELELLPGIGAGLGRRFGGE